MFKSCCARPNKKKCKAEVVIINSNSESYEEAEQTIDKDKEIVKRNEKIYQNQEDCKKPSITSFEKEIVERNIGVSKEIDIPENLDVEKESIKSVSETKDGSSLKVSFDELMESDDDTLKLPTKRELSKKRYSMDYLRSRLEIKRYSVDFRPDSTTLEQLLQLEKDLARTNIDVRPGFRRKSSGILKSTISNETAESFLSSQNKDSFSDDDEVFEKPVGASQDEGPKEPPATPIGRDELALRRHRFFSDLICAARAAAEHRVRFDPLGPMIADSGADDSELIGGVNPATELLALIERLERVTSRLEHITVRKRLPTPPDSPGPKPSEEKPEVVDTMSVNGFQDIVQGPLRTFLQLSQQIGGDVATHANLVNAAFQAQMNYIKLAASRAKPAQSEEMQLLTPTSQQITAIQQFREKNRTSQYFNHLSAISESIPALGWVAISPAPSPYVKEMNDAGQFYTNRVLKEWKDKDKRHAEWCRAWVQLLSELQAYVKQHHTTGLVWAGKGAGAPPPPSGGMPPPPPVLPDIDFSNMSIDDRSALFAEINQGENITSHLKRVTPDMQTHKNPTLRTGPAPFKAAPAPPVRGAAKPLPQPGAGNFADKPPVFNRDGKKWLIEYQKGNQNLVVDNADMNNVVYMYRCRDSALTVKGKINGVVLDSCTKCAVVFDNLVSSIEFVNCQSVQMQVLGKVPTISVDKTDGCQIYLSPESLDVEVVSSKSSEMNVLLPKPNGDYTELPIPEQFKTKVNRPPTSLTTTPVENKG